MQPTLRSQSDDATRDRYPARSLGFSNQGAALRYPHRLAGDFAQNNSSQQFGNANDCHDESGRFCEGGSAAAIAAQLPEPNRVKRDLTGFDGYVVETTPSERKGGRWKSSPVYSADMRDHLVSSVANLLEAGVRVKVNGKEIKLRGA